MDQGSGVAVAASGNRDQLANLDRGSPWLVYCAIGGRAELTSEAMAELGFEKVYLLKGGFIEWRAQWKSVVKWSGPDVPPRLTVLPPWA